MMHKPWLPEDAVEFMESILTPASWVIEHGAGYSTVWLAKKVDYLVSYESDPKWYTRIGSILYKESLLDHTVLIHATDIAEKGALLPRNAPRGPVYDLLFIDGRGRMRMWQDHERSVRPGGWVCFDDAERPKYHQFVKETAEWEARQFYKSEKPYAFTLFVRKPNA